jgi:DNA repair exonuclease SbcCD ATPase subunit
MNAAKQEMFESVRAVVSGRLRDDMQVRELAHRVSEESTALRRRIERAVGYARAGLRLEACAEAEAEPTVFELAGAFDNDVMRQWRALCAKNRLPVQDEIPPESIAEIEEAIAATAPLRRRLALMRRLVLSDASAWHRLEVLRELVSRDPENPAWQDDRAALEPVAADELGDRFEEDLAKGRLDDAEECVHRLEDGKWHWSGAAKVGAQLRAKLDRALAARATGEAREVVARLDAEWSAENEDGARAAVDDWRALEQRMLSYGSDMPGDLLARVDEVEAWLAARDADAAAVRENRDRVAALERVAHDEASTLAQLRAALRAAEQTVEGVPDDIRDVAERRIEARERAARMRRTLAIGAAVLALAAGTAVTVVLLRRAEATKHVEEVANAVVGNVKADRLDEAERLLAEADKDPAVAGAPQVAQARDQLAAARNAVAEKHRRFESTMAEAGDPESASARADRVEEAKQYVQGEKEQSAVADWLRRQARATDARRTARMQEGIARARATVREIAAAVPGADASWDGKFTSWESALADVARQYGEFDEVRREVDAGRTALAAQRAKTGSARSEEHRIGRLAELGSAATSPASLVTALEAYSKDHPDAPEAKDFAEAAGARAAWESVAAWAAVQPRPTAALADRPQKERDAAAAAADAYAAASPASPYAAACAAVKPLLAAAPAWRPWLTEKLGTIEAMTLWSIDRKDGTHWYCRSDPRKVPLQPQGGTASKAVTVLDGRSMKQRFESFDQAQIKYEGPSPQMTFAKQVADALSDDEKWPNDLAGAFACLSMLRDADAIDGALSAQLMRGLLEAMSPEMPECVRPQMEQAAKRIAREKADEIDWLNPHDPEARERSKKARATMREAVQPELWRKAYVAALSDACAPLQVLYRPAGVLVKPAGKPSFLPATAKAPAAGTVLWAVDAPVGGKAGAMLRIGTVGADGAVQFEGVASSIPAGTLVFVPGRGGTP